MTLLALPAELRVAIWRYVFSDYATIVHSPKHLAHKRQYDVDDDVSEDEDEHEYVEYLSYPGKLDLVRVYPEYVYRIFSSGNTRARYSGHPLFYVNKLISNESAVYSIRQPQSSSHGRPTT